MPYSITTYWTWDCRCVSKFGKLLPARTYYFQCGTTTNESKLQHCLQEYKFAIYNNEDQRIINAITNFQSKVPTDIPVDKLDIFEEHFENALRLALVKKLQKLKKNIIYLLKIIEIFIIV